MTVTSSPPSEQLERKLTHGTTPGIILTLLLTSFTIYGMHIWGKKQAEARALAYYNSTCICKKVNLAGNPEAYVWRPRRACGDRFNKPCMPDVNEVD